MRTADFYFHLPRNLIASRPLDKRDNSRLLVLHKNGDIEHKKFYDIIEYLNEGDMLVVNNTKVFPARIIAVKHSGGKLDILLVREVDKNGVWEIMCKGRIDGTVTIGDGVMAEVWAEGVKGKESRAKKFLRFLNIESSKVQDVLWQYGYMPLPPYINRMPDDTDKQRYQTVYAEYQGSIAAPTAGLHFTEELLNKIRNKGILVETLTLHVGIGTFKPIKTEWLQEHKMDPEYFEMKTSLLNKIQKTKESGNRLITVGTTTTRAIEAVFSMHQHGRDEISPMRPLFHGVDEGEMKSSFLTNQNGSIKGFADIFIYPGYEFRAIDGLVTNFHLPCSTPLMLVSALRGFRKILYAYKEAIAMGYRFFSYGDAMLIL
ncbi:S-adenosylmethionine:tRNA ribosyltransferase-isomerase [Dissulfurispira thermophila]|uniref:S-adenosylmethionine:tRNA ribosyltransferase-isomerase n=2 Tax=root TaxID=1 RepID=A0A7G1H4T8_9BACT|nr:S-adenosylmethionine:tRNA ribosyltransferase-isomerase [Dissulfurispira thermophila]